MDTRYYSGTCTLNYYCLQLDHENLIVFTRWSQSTLFSGPLSKIFFCLFCLLPQEMICKVNENNSVLIVVSFISSKLKKVTLVCQINIFSLTSYSESDLYLSMAWLNNLLWKLISELLTFSLLSPSSMLKLTIIYDTLWSVRNRVFSVQIGMALLLASETFPRVIGVPSFLVRKVENESFPWSHNLGERIG